MENVEPLRTSEEIKNMREALNQTYYPERNLLLFNLGINTGLRVGDLLQLKIEDVKHKTSVRINEGKVDKPRKVYLGALMAEITEYICERTEGYLFESRQKGKPVTTTQAYRILADAGYKCGYDYVGTHTMRKTFGYHYYKRTLDVATLMEIFNHSSQSITKRYIGIREDEIQSSLVDFKL